MPVKFPSLSGSAILKALKLAKPSGVELEIDYGPGGLVFRHPPTNGVYRRLELGFSDGLELVKGTCSEAKADTLRGLVAEVLAEIKNGKLKPVPWNQAFWLAKPAAPAIGPPAAPPPAEKWPEFNAGEMTTATPVALVSATHLYQPVRGSSPNSRYFLVAANADIRIAARYISDSLSVRIEGPGWAKNRERIKACGFTNVNDTKEYASMHLSVDNDVVAAKALGAILLGLGVPLETPLPDVCHLKNKVS